MDLFSVVRIDAPQRMTVGVRPRRNEEVPLLEATAGRVVRLNVPESSESEPAINAEPVQQVQPNAEPVAEKEPTPPFVDLGESSDESEVESLRRTRKRDSDGGESSKRPRVNTEAGTSASHIE